MESPSPALSWTPFRDWKASPEPSILQTREPQLSQLVFILVCIKSWKYSVWIQIFWLMLPTTVSFLSSPNFRFSDNKPNLGTHWPISFSFYVWIIPESFPINGLFSVPSSEILSPGFIFLEACAYFYSFTAGVNPSLCHTDPAPLDGQNHHKYSHFPCLLPWGVSFVEYCLRECFLV